MGKLPLEGIRVVDFTWALAGPSASRYLADMGAEDIKIESRYRLNMHRFMAPLGGKDDLVPESSGYFHISSRNKLSITLDVNTPKGVEVCKRLVKISDVVIENFSPKAMKKFGLEYPVLREVNPAIIMCSMAGMGQTGPYGGRGYRSLGPGLQSLSGMREVTGWPDRPPCGIGGGYPDYIGGTHAAFAILVALEYRRKTGKGQYIDLSQHETCGAIMGLPLLDYIVNNRAQGRVGNFNPCAAPHGCYRCKGEDRWCAIEVRTDEEWESFCRVLGNPEWSKEPRFATMLGRVKNVEELDRLAEGWTINLSAEEVMEKMQGAGVAAGVVQNAQDLVDRDPHMRERGFYETIEHPVSGNITLDGMYVKFSQTPGSIRTPPPLLGQHTDYVLKEILGMSQEEIDQLKAEGVLN